ncbi:Pcp1 [Kluyveromyces lactis]|nr:Pcp1 [Kluyveromyces lactis]
MSGIMNNFARNCGKQFFLSNAIHLQAPKIAAPLSLLTPLKSSLFMLGKGTSNLNALFKPRSRFFTTTSNAKINLRDMFNGSQSRYTRLNRFQQFNRGSGNSSGLIKLTLYGVLFMGGTLILAPYLFQIPPFSYFKRHPTHLPYAIIGINLAVFGLWQLPRFWGPLQRYALLQKDHIYSKWSLLGSAFSHQEFWHLGMNMICLFSFGTSLATMLGPGNFTSLYLNSAIAGSLFSLWYPRFAKIAMMGPSLGASGALFGLFGCFSYLIPNAKMMFFIFPVPFGAWFTFLGLVTWNVVGCALRWGSFDYAAHLGGSAMGVLYGWLVAKSIQKQREKRLSLGAFPRF